MDVEELKEEIKSLKGHDGITLSGGDPMFQIESSNEIAKFCKEIGLNVWCYTGFTFEELLKMRKTNESLNEFMHNVDVLVDGKFIEAKKSLNLYFRGSSNQRILDMKESLRKRRPVEIEKYKYVPDVRQTLFGKTEFMFI